MLVTHHLGDGAKVAHEVVGAVRVGVVEAVVHRRAELGYDRAVRASAEPGCDVADPLVVCHRAIEEGVGVEREQRRVEAAVAAQVPQVLAGAGAADEHPAGRGRVVGAEPVGCDVAPLGRAVTARLVHWLEVHVGVRPVGADHGGPHGVPRGEVRYPCAGGVVRPKGEDDLESMGSSGVNGAAVGVPPGCVDHCLSVDRQPDGVDPHGGCHVVVEGIGLALHGRVAVGRTEALDNEWAGAEVVTQLCPVHAAEAVGGWRLLRCQRHRAERQADAQRKYRD